MAESNLVKRGNLWQHTDENGEIFFSGSWADKAMLILPNHASKSPTHKVYVFPFSTGLQHLAKKSVKQTIEKASTMVSKKRKK